MERLSNSESETEVPKLLARVDRLYRILEEHGGVLGPNELCNLVLKDPEADTTTVDAFKDLVSEGFSDSRLAFADGATKIMLVYPRSNLTAQCD